MLGMNLLQAQENSFVRSYNAYASWNKVNDTWGEWEDTDVLVCYNYKGTNKVALYLDQDSPLILYPIGSIENKTNAEGLNYQIMNYIDKAGEEISLSLFDNGVLMIFGAKYMFKLNPAD